MIKGNVDKITNLSMDLLNYAKGIEIQCRPADPNQPVQEVIQLMTPLASEHGIDLTAEIDPNLANLNYDPELVHSCLLNLVANAIDACKAAPSTDGIKKVTVSASLRPGHGVEYRVADNGCGMDAQTRAKLFQRFFTTKGSAGTGIGLMATKKIVDAHGGEIRVASKKNQGSTFTIRIPSK
jgi:signal transduction histidine kinase